MTTVSLDFRRAKYVLSAHLAHQLPQDEGAEVAFAGRSNVGKSSAINAITNQNNLAKTSKTPGRTQQINFFDLDAGYKLVDLPGYGYAKVSKSTKKVFQKFITAYFSKREQLVCAFVLVDIRHEPQTVDLEFMQWLGEHGIPFTILFTKADKLRPKAINNHVENYKSILLESWEEMPNYFITSSSKHLGKEDVLNYIDSLNENMIID